VPESGSAQPASPWSGLSEPGAQQYAALGGDAAGAPQAGRRRRRHRRLAAAAIGVTVVGVAAASGSALAAGTGRSLSTPQIAATVDPGLVDVTATLGYAHAGAAGTGMVLTSDGEVLTNNHVVEGATALKATDIGNGRTYRAVVVGYDRTHDIAVIKLQGASGLKTVAFGDSTKVAPGQRVVALGNAGGRGGKPSVAPGRVVELGQSITATDASAGTSERLAGLIHTNAPIQPGDSGGPLVNSAGEVVGINTAASAGTQFRFQSGKGQTQAYAIPVSQAKAIAAQIKAGRASDTVHIGPTAFLGVQVLPVGAPGSGTAGSGASVAAVLPGSPTAKAGLSGGVTIVAVGGHAVTSPSTLQSALGHYHPGDQVTIRWVDATGLTHVAPLTLANGPAG
jgi:S1-C subfamily serine protease